MTKRQYYFYRKRNKNIKWKDNLKKELILRFYYFRHLKMSIEPKVGKNLASNSE